MAITVTACANTISLCNKPNQLKVIENCAMIPCIDVTMMVLNKKIVFVQLISGDFQNSLHNMNINFSHVIYQRV